MLESPLLLVFPLAMAYAAVSDIMTLTIPNRISLVLIATFCIVAPLAGFSWQTMAQHAAVGAAVLAVGFVLFALGIFGGGDAKLLAAATLWMGQEHLSAYLGGVALIGGVMCVLILFYRRLVPAAALPLPAWALRLHNPKTGVPYAIAISGAALMIYPKTQWFVAFTA